MNKVLFLSPVTPYDTIGHAGGKTINCYVKGLSKYFDVTVVSLADESERNKLDLNSYGIANHVRFIHRYMIHKLMRRVFDWSFFYNAHDTYANLMPWTQRCTLMKMLRRLKNEGYLPDIVQLEFTGTVLMVDKVHKLFPDARITASEHDVTFLRYEREAAFEQDPSKKQKALLHYEICRQKELAALEKCDLIVPHNVKDAKLLLQNYVPADKIHSIVPYYMHLKPAKYNANSNKILFFGAMGRKENYLSAIWFIDHVLPQLPGIVFYVVGGNPPKQLLNRASHQIIVTGFVNRIEEYFSDALCMVAPLLLGAGIKVKVLEAMSAGVVTLTNEIGIEGIPAKDGDEYLFCKKPEDYVRIIQKLRSGEIDGQKISENARAFTQKQFDVGNSVRQYAETLKKL